MEETTGTQEKLGWLVTKSVRDVANRANTLVVKFFMPDINEVSRFEAENPSTEPDPTKPGQNARRDKDYSGGNELLRRTGYAMATKKAFAKFMKPYYEAAKNETPFEKFVDAICYADMTLLLFINQVLGRENEAGMFQ